MVVVVSRHKSGQITTGGGVGVGVGPPHGQNKVGVGIPWIVVVV